MQPQTHQPQTHQQTNCRQTNCRHYCHTIRFRGSSHPQGRYQLQISEVRSNGQPHYRAQWDFSTLRNLLTFLKKYFPNSQAFALPGHQASLAFEQVLAIVDYPTSRNI